VLGKYAAGISDDLLTATLLATRAPVIICPAMHTEMWEHPAVQENVATLRRRGVHVVDPGVGHLAGGDQGVGRLAEPDDIVFAVERVLGPNDFAGTKVLVTAGGTREAIDPVRVVTNRSSGKQGYAIAAEAAARGATVVLVTTVERPVPPGIAEVVRVASAADMQQAVMSRADASDVVVMAAAVADFRPKEIADHKIKKGDGLSEIVLEPTHDFLVDLGRTKRAGQVIVGFAAETGDLRQRALGKLEAKRLDLIVGNDVSADAVGFEHDTNEVVLLRPGLADQHVPLTGKRQVAAAVLDAVADIRRS
jgi:phosphopantothenoylcysteine decarboxylase/phosphopantothenate--cysteine ligase